MPRGVPRWRRPKYVGLVGQPVSIDLDKITPPGARCATCKALALWSWIRYVGRREDGRGLFCGECIKKMILP